MSAPSPKKALMLGAAWAVAMRWSVKAIGFLSTVIMARLLMPADYGVVAMAMLVVGLIQAFLDSGATTALLRKGEVERDEIDSAWTLRLITGCMVGLILALVAVPAAAYFQEPRVQPVLWVLAACVAMASAGNIGMTLAVKALNFSLEFRLAVTCKLLSVAATVVAGYFLRDYRALVIGVASGYLLGLLCSYLMHPYRPRWNTTRIAEIWAVTKWLMFAGVASFVLRKGDELIAARIGSTQEFGMYNVGADLGQLPTGEVGPAVLRAFLPVLSSIQSDAERTNQAVIKTLAAVNTLTLAIGLGMFAFAPHATSFILGGKWVGAAPFVALFALISTLQIMSSPLQTLLTLRGHTRVQSYFVWAEFGVFLLAAAVLAPLFGIIGLAYARLIGTSANMGLAGLATRRLCGLSIRSVVKGVARPLAGSMLTLMLVELLFSQIEGLWLQAALGLPVALLFYAGWCAVTWRLSGRPEGLESTVSDVFRTRGLTHRKEGHGRE